MKTIIFMICSAVVLILLWSFLYTPVVERATAGIAMELGCSIASHSQEWNTDQLVSITYTDYGQIIYEYKVTSHYQPGSEE